MLSIIAITRAFPGTVAAELSQSTKAPASCSPKNALLPCDTCLSDLSMCLIVRLCTGLCKLYLACSRIFTIGAARMEQLLSVEEAARRLGGISKWTVHAWLSQGRLRRTKVGGRTMIRESELKKVVEDGGVSPAPRRKEEAV